MKTIDKLKIMLEAPPSTSIVAYRIFLKEMLEESEKYRWHDLRKDPKDLPEDDRKVECITLTKSRKSNHVFGYFDRRWVCGMCSNVIAWKEIEPFEENEI